MLILSGYQKFVDFLASTTNFDVYLNQKVKKVIWKEGESDVVCASGITVSAKNVVMALPIGVLKAKGI
jgi:predicted NAD/FAD-dependent oxidoreductase